MKRILYIMEATTGGTRRHLDDLVHHIDRTRYEPVVACSMRRDDEYAHSVAAMRQDGIVVHKLDMRREWSPIADTTAVAELTRLIRERQPDLVHTHSTKAGLLGRIAARRAATPCAVVHTPHGFPFEMQTLSLLRRVYRLVEKTELRITDAIVCVCPEEEQIARQLAADPHQAIWTIPNGIDTATPPFPREEARRLRQELHVPDGALVAGWVGRHCRQKGLPVLAEAAHQLKQLQNPPVFVLVGDGADRDALRQRCCHAGIDSLFRFVPSTPNPAAYYGMFDIFVLPSLWEALPYALLDALWAGIPVVASNVGGVGGLLHRSGAGRAIPAGNADALAETLTSLVSDPGAREAYASKGHDYIREHHALSDMMARTHQLYDYLLCNGESTEQA